MAMVGCLVVIVLCPARYINPNEYQDKADEYIKDMLAQK